MLRDALNNHCRASEGMLIEAESEGELLIAALQAWLCSMLSY